LQNYFGLTAAARAFNPSKFAKMSDVEAYAAFKAIRFADNGGEPFCPRCGCVAVYEFNCRPVFKCKGCDRQFRVTTGTSFADRKMSFQQILEAAAHFVMRSKGISSIELSQYVGVTQITAFKLLQKLRTAIGTIDPDVVLGGEVEIDGLEIGGYIRPRNNFKRAKSHKKWPFAHSKKKQTIVVVRQRQGKIRTTVVKKEAEGVPFIKAHITPDVVLYSDKGNAWSQFGITYDLRQVNHSEQYWSEWAHENGAESFFAHVRRTAFGVYHHISGVHLQSYANEAAWRQEHNRKPNEQKFDILLQAMMQTLSPAVKLDRRRIDRRPEITQ
jgi:transposase-like protein